MPVPSSRRRFAILAVFGLGVWAVAATGASRLAAEIPPVTGFIRLDAQNPAALSRVLVQLPPQADPRSAEVDLSLEIDSFRFVSPVPPVTGASPAPGYPTEPPASGAAPHPTTLPEPTVPGPAWRFIVTAAAPGSDANVNTESRSAPGSWQAFATVGKPLALPVDCPIGPCERAFWLIAQADGLTTESIEVDWHIEGELVYVTSVPEGATATVTIDAPVAVAGMAPELVVQTEPEAVTVGPAAPAAARVVEVTLTGNEAGGSRAIAALDVDLRGEAVGATGEVLVEVTPISGTPWTQPRATPLLVEPDPFADCDDEDPCTRRFLVSFAWTGQTPAPIPFTWTATVRRTDLLGAWASSATTTIDVVRRLDLADAEPQLLHLESDVAPVAYEPSTQARVALWSRTGSRDPIAALLPVPVTMTYRARETGAGAKATEPASASIASRIPGAWAMPFDADFADGAVEIIATPMANRTVACHVGEVCPVLDMAITPQAPDGGDRPGATFHWSLDLETWSWEDVPVVVEVSATGAP